MACAVLSIALVLAPNHSLDVVAAQPISLLSADGVPASLVVSTAGPVFIPADGAPAARRWTDTALLLTFDGPPPTTTTLPPPPILVPPTLRERALNKLAELGAPQWVVRGLDCLGWAESGWQAIRSKYMNDNGTWDHSFWQFNDIHWPRLNRMGLNPYIPEDAAVFAWTLYSESGFGPWSATRAKCGV
jgi:hypothetical protein